MNNVIKIQKSEEKEIIDIGGSPFSDDKLKGDVLLLAAPGYVGSGNTLTSSAVTISFVNSTKSIIISFPF